VDFSDRWGGATPGRRKPRRTAPHLEALEERCCPALWDWVSPVNTSWSNPGGGNWLRNGAPVAPGQYPGQVPGDMVTFDNGGSTRAVLDKPLNSPLLSLTLTQNWVNTLRLSTSLLVQGPLGNFVLTTGSTITMDDGAKLTLLNLGSQAPTQNVWDGGSIIGGSGTGLYLTGTELSVQGSGVGRLGTQLVIQKDAGVQNGRKGYLDIGGSSPNLLTSNLVLNGAANYIDVGNGGYLELGQQIVDAGQQNLEGGIAFDPAHTGKQAVLVESGGELDRAGGTPVQGVPNQVSIAGAVYNEGGVVDVQSGMLNLTGTDANGYSYWQDTAATSLLHVASGMNLNAAGTYRIDFGEVQLTAPSGGFADELDGLGLIFGNANSTKLTLLDSTPGTPGQVTVQGPVTLAANTTTTLNFVGNSTSADLLDVKNGTLTLRGALKLLSTNGNKPSGPINVFDDSGLTPTITDLGIVVTDNAGGNNDSGLVVQNNPQLFYFQVTIP
jgi:hypothetical protein